jgi:hypothetical protein
MRSSILPCASDRTRNTGTDLEACKAHEDRLPPECSLCKSIIEAASLEMSAQDHSRHSDRRPTTGLPREAGQVQSRSACLEGAQKPTFNEIASESNNDIGLTVLQAAKKYYGMSDAV